MSLPLFLLDIRHAFREGGCLPAFCAHRRLSSGLPSVLLLLLLPLLFLLLLPLPLLHRQAHALQRLESGADPGIFSLVVFVVDFLRSRGQNGGMGGGREREEQQQQQ